MDKSRLKSLLYNYEVRIVTVITDGIMAHRSKRDVLNRARKEVLRLKLDVLEKNELWKFTLEFYRHTVAAAGRESDAGKRAEKVYTVLRQDTPLLEHQKNVIADSIEFRKKNRELTELLSGDGKFYYCTAHKNPAAGHAAYQGKIYYRRNMIYSDVEEQFIDKNGLMAVEDVVLGPVWLCTRRNCTHRLIEISFSEAQTGRFRHESGGTEMTYAEEQYGNYKDRLKMLIGVKKVFENSDVMPEQLKRDVKKTYGLCRAWNRRIRKS